MIIDSHCHLSFETYDEERERIINEALQKNVGFILNVATEPKEYADMVGVIEKYPFIYGAYGIHPESVDPDNIITLPELLQFLHHLKIIGVGETGLDYHYENVDRKYQQESFMIHIEAARQTDMPLIIHTRDADADLKAILTEQMLYKPFKGMIHCFSSSENLAKTAIDLGLYISISGIITFKKAEELRTIIKKLPLDRLLIETDAPFLAPVPYRGKRNEPAFVVETFKALAQLKGVKEDVLEEQLMLNFKHLFKNKLGKELFV